MACHLAATVTEANMMRRMRVGVLYGGRSGEHEISLRSASAVIAALDPSRFDIVAIAIGKDGRWRTGIDSLRLLDEAQRALREIPPHGIEVALAPEPTRRALVPLAEGVPIPLDVVFPVLHGTYGEDGTVQGLLELADLPYVGSGVLASSVGMDKGLMKAVLHDAGIPVCRWLVVRPREESFESIVSRVAAEIGFPCFVKPANLGSSVGISKVRTRDDLAAAIDEAGAYDLRAVVEEAIACREIECSVIGNENPEASVLAEVVPSHDFYDYADKYVDDGAKVLIPAPLASPLAERMRQLAVDVFRVTDAAGLARVDFFLENGTERVLVNEINTMPGCTPSSGFPKMWEASGVPFSRVVERLIDLAIARHQARMSRRLSFTPPTSTAPAGQRSSGGSL
jgi:D-alanine-D-alanine ligase